MSYYWLAIIAYVADAIPMLFWLSVAITVVHTVEESAGQIWKELCVPAWLYFSFQAFVLFLSWLAIVEGIVGWVFVSVRLVDMIGTHWILRKPGVYTSTLLLADAGLLIRSW